MGQQGYPPYIYTYASGSYLKFLEEVLGENVPAVEKFSEYVAVRLTAISSHLTALHQKGIDLPALFQAGYLGTVKALDAKFAHQFRDKKPMDMADADRLVELIAGLNGQELNVYSKPAVSQFKTWVEKDQLSHIAAIHSVFNRNAFVLSFGIPLKEQIGRASC